MVCLSSVLPQPMVAEDQFSFLDQMLNQQTSPLRSILLGVDPLIDHTAKTKYQNFETNVPRKGISGSQSQFPHSCMCLWAIYIFPRSVCLFCRRKYVDRSWNYINRSQTHECGNWGWGRAIPRKGIHKWDFRCSAVDKMAGLVAPGWLVRSNLRNLKWQA